MVAIPEGPGGFGGPTSRRTSEVTSGCRVATGAAVAQVPKPRPRNVVEVPNPGCRLGTETPPQGPFCDGAGDRIRTGDPLLGKHYPICAVLQTWEQREMLSSYLLLRSGHRSDRTPNYTLSARREPCGVHRALIWDETLGRIGEVHRSRCPRIGQSATCDRRRGSM